MTLEMPCQIVRNADFLSISCLSAMVCDDRAGVFKDCVRKKSDKYLRGADVFLDDGKGKKR